jgi:hypothetical protein
MLLRGLQSSMLMEEALRSRGWFLNKALVAEGFKGVRGLE